MISNYNPEVAGTFTYTIMNLFFPPIWGNFGSDTSPADYIHITRAIGFLDKHLSIDEYLVMKHAKVLNLVNLDVEYDPSRESYIQSTPEIVHKVFYDSSKVRGINIPTTHL